MAFATYHNHTTFCDGQSTAEEMVLAAIEAGCPCIGFSGHSHTPFDESYCMSPAGTRAYQTEIRRLEKRYAGKIRVCLGVEQDLFSDQPVKGYDYVIGSVHYVRKNGFYLPVDNSPEKLMAGVNGQYGGDILAFCEDYYRQVSLLRERTACTIVGHFDLVTKFNEGQRLFSQSSARYVQAAMTAAETLCRQNALFEINTGAMAKGWRTAPYPERSILERIRELGGRVILNADCHRAEQLLYGLEDARRLADSVGIPVVEEL